MGLPDLPIEIFRRLLQQCVITLGLCQGIKLQLVCRLFDREIQDAFYSTKLLEMYPHHPQGGVSRSLLSKYLYSRTVADRTNSNNFAAILHRVVEYLSSQEQPKAKAQIEDLERALIFSLCEAAANDAQWHDCNSWALVGFLRPNNNADLARDAESLDRHKLAAAAYFGKKLLVQTLIEGCTRDTDGMTSIGSPLQYAAKGGNSAVAQLLLDQPEANLTTRVSEGNPLSVAAFVGHTNVVRILLEPQYGYIANREAYGEAVLQAARGGHQELIELIKRSAENIPFPSVEDQILCQAAHCGQENVVRMALENGADVNICDKKSMRKSPISLATSRGHQHIVQLLLARGANQHLPERGTTLSLAAQRGFRYIVQLLMNNGNYDFNDPSINKNAALSPLKVAAERGQADMVRFILDRGIDISTYKEVGEMALRTAATNGPESVVRMLLDAGVDVDGRDETRSPMLAALCHGRDHIVRTLMERGARKVDPEKTIYAEKFRNGTFPTRIRVQHGGVYVADYKH